MLGPESLCVGILIVITRVHAGQSREDCRAIAINLQ